MSSHAVAEVLERVSQAHGRLLRVERAPLPGPAGSSASAALRLSFDVAIVTLHLDAEGTALEIATDPGAPVRAEGFVSADEDEPWWAVLGNPLTWVEAPSQGGIRVQFRHDDEAPRRFHLLPAYGGIRVEPDR